jgi:hypothetical protein
MRAKVIRVRCTKCKSRQDFFFRLAENRAGDPQLMNALDPYCPDPHFLIRDGRFIHVVDHECQENDQVKLTRRSDVRICPVCLRPSPDEPNRVACKWQDCRAVFIKAAIHSGTGSHKIGVTLVSPNGVVQ